MFEFSKITLKLPIHNHLSVEYAATSPKNKNELLISVVYYYNKYVFNHKHRNNQDDVLAHGPIKRRKNKLVCVEFFVGNYNTFLLLWFLNFTITFSSF